MASKTKTSQPRSPLFKCVSSASISQNDIKFGDQRNKQCVCISICAATVATHRRQRAFFNRRELDNIIEQGDKYYNDTKTNLGPNHTHPYLNPDEAARVLRYLNDSFMIETNWVGNGLYAENEIMRNDRENELARTFEDQFALNSQCGYIFMGLSSAVSVWKANNSYFIFNSHSINNKGLYCENGVGRLFRANNIKGLAQFLLQTSPLDNIYHQYEIHEVKVSPLEMIADHRVADINNADRIITDRKLSSNNVIIPTDNVIIKVNNSNTSELYNDPKLTSKAVVVLVDITHQDKIHEVKFSSLEIIADTRVADIDITGRIIADTKLSCNNAVIPPHNVIKKVNNSNTSELLKDPKLSSEAVVVLVDIRKDLQNDYEIVNNECNLLNTKKRPGRPLKTRVGRPKTSMLTEEEQHRVAVQNYSDKNPEINRKAVEKYTENNPEVHRKAVEKYTESNPEVHRKAVEKYTENNPEIHRKAVEKYTENNPEVHRKAVEKYTENNPEVHRKAVEKYTENNPEVNREAVEKYNKTFPGRHLPTPLRKANLVGEFCGNQLTAVKPYQLKNPSLKAADCFKCPNCRSPLFEEEKQRSQWCCGQGRFNVLKLDQLSEPFYQSNIFQKHSRRYNDMFAFCALEVPAGYHHPKKGISFLKIQGRVYHKIFDLSYRGPKTNTGALYIDDGQERLRQAQTEDLSVPIVTSIQKYLEVCNPYIDLYKRLYNEPSDQAHLVFESTTRRTHGPVMGDAPQSTEVAAIISCDSEPYTPRKLCIWKVGDARPHYVYAFHPLIEPLQYPLLYPKGNPGWHINCKDNFGRKLSQLKYTRCLLLSEDRFSKFGRLSETWLVDMFARIDEERLRFIQFSQKKNPNDGGLRIAPVDEISNVIDNKNVIPEILRNDETVQGDGPIVPDRVYLPHTYTGGPRYMRVSYMDAMALVTRLGGPTYFLTFTAFGGWKEIIESRKGKKSEAHIIDRVFQLKLQELLRDIRCGKFFGVLSYIVWVIEFQMRGLPHAHICFRVQGGGPIQNHEIDLVVRADIPNEDEAEGRLRSLVLKHMVHGPCGTDHRTDFPCWDNELQKCTKYFPKPNTETTYADDKGFVHYRRNSNNKGIIFSRKNPVEVDDRWIVPYNAALLLKYECHVNIEIASARRVVKYLFKYISKGSPLRRMVVLEESEQNDEVEDYVTKRYIGASDAAWRILEFDVTGREPSVSILPVHLEGKHTAIFRQGEEQDALEKATSKLLLYFNRPNVEALDNVTYLEFYEQYIVHTKRPSSTAAAIYDHPDGKHFITARQRGSCVARLFWVAATRGEQYFLRMLLLRYTCRSYNDLYALGGDQCRTFQQAAIVLGLADNNREYAEALEEASRFMNANRLRQFYVILSTIGAPVADLWETFRNSLCEDFLEQMPDDNEKAIKLGLIHIDRCLRRQGSSLVEAGLPVVDDIFTELGREKLQYSVQLQENYFAEWEPRMSNDQQQVLQYVKMLIHDESSQMSRLLFLDGPGGYGKTALLKVIAAYVRSIDRVVLCVATSGIAALNLNGGTTAHSMFRIPLDLSDGTGYWSITNGTQRAELIRFSSVIIFDEISMAHKHVIEMLDRSLKDLMQNDQHFGGKIVIFAGDFRQIPPVIENAKSPSDIINISIRKSNIWNLLVIFKLTTAHRTCGEYAYGEFLLKLGADNVPHRNFGDEGRKEVLVPLTNINFTTNVEDLISFVFPKEILENPDECAKRAVLCTLNRNVREINALVTNMLVGDYHQLYSLDSVAESDNPEQFDDALLHEAEGKGVPGHIIKLKVGSICMIMRNLNFDMGLVNGTKVVIQAISRRLITVRKPGSSELFGIPRISFKFPIFNKCPIEMLRRQFPLQPCYAISFHKSQGQTIDMVGLDLRSDCFTHGQLYVGMSRVRSAANLLVLLPQHRIVEGVPYTKNIVYRELIEM